MAEEVASTLEVVTKNELTEDNEAKELIESKGIDEVSVIKQAEEVKSDCELTEKPKFPPYLVFSSEEPNERFLLGCNYDPVEAKRRWDLTREWRTRENIDLILETPQYNFHLIKKFYPHGVYSTGKNGNKVYIERPGKADLNSLWNEGITAELFARHYVFITEWCWRILDTREDARMITVYDIGNTRLVDFAGTVVQFFKSCSSVMQAHYVERSDKIFILNARWWFKTAWKIASPMLHENVKKKIVVLPDGFYEPLIDYIGAENLPECYGGTCAVPFEEATAEMMIREHVDLFLKDAPPPPPRPIPERGRSKKEAVVHGWNKSKTQVVRIAGNIKNWYWRRGTTPDTTVQNQSETATLETATKPDCETLIEEDNILPALSPSATELNPEFDEEFASLFVGGHMLEPENPSLDGTKETENPSLDGTKETENPSLDGTKETENAATEELQTKHNI